MWAISKNADFLVKSYYLNLVSQFAMAFEFPPKQMGTRKLPFRCHSFLESGTMGKFLLWMIRVEMIPSLLMVVHFCLQENGSPIRSVRGSNISLHNLSSVIRTQLWMKYGLGKIFQPTSIEIISFHLYRRSLCGLHGTKEIEFFATKFLNLSISKKLVLDLKLFV